MIVFKHYFQIVKSYLPMILMFVVIFLGFAIFATKSSSETTSFSTLNPKIALINYDQNSKLIQSFDQYLETLSERVEIKEEQEAIDDALFFEQINYLIEIPEGFTEKFLNGEEVQLKTKTSPNSYTATYTEMFLNKFLNTARIYREAGYEEEKISSLTLDSLKSEVPLHHMEKDSGTAQSQIQYFYNFGSYVFFALMIMVIGMIMSSFNKSMIKKRNIVAPISYKKQNRILFLGHMTFCLAIWLFFVLISIILYGKAMFTVEGGLIILNLLVFGMSALGFAFLIGSLVDSQEAVSSISNIVALGSSFLSGAFVPQELLGTFTLTIAHILPSYWLIANNNEIMTLNTFGTSELLQIFSRMGVMVLFAIFFLVLTNLVSRKRRQSA